MNLTNEQKILLVLYPDKEGYGYELAQTLGIPIDGVYTALKRLENDDKFLQSRKEDMGLRLKRTREQGAMGARRKYYSLSPDGRTVVKTFLEDAMEIMNREIVGLD